MYDQSYKLNPWPKKERIRPSWWGPAEVLDLLQRGEPTPLLCQRASEECGGAVSPRRLRADISEWCQSLSYGEPMTAAVKLWRRDTGGSGEMILSDDWHDEFIAALELCEGNIADAAEAACIGVDLVYVRLDEHSKHYNREFADKVHQLETLRMSPIRENYLKQAAVPTPDGAKLAKDVLATAMPTLHGTRKKVEMIANVNVQHSLAPEVVAASAARTKALMGNRHALHSGDRAVIDVPAVLVREALEE